MTTNGSAPRRAEALLPCVLLTGLMALIGTLGFLAGHAVGSDQPGTVTLAAPANPTGPAMVIPMEPTTEPSMIPTATPEAPPTPTVLPTVTPRWTPSNAPQRGAGRPCAPEAVRCIHIAAATRDGNLLTVEWLAHGFDPAMGGHHAHFYWDIYEPGQAGNNASSFGMTAGSWDAVGAQPYVKDLSTMPSDATALCATVGTATHGVDDPTYAECVTVPPG